MKTSNKLLIIFFSCIPLSLLAYNALLKQEYNAGNFVSKFYPDGNSNYQETKLPAFKHVVINGLIKSPNIESYQFRMPVISISNTNSYPKGGSNQNRIRIISQYAEILKTAIKNDTLYVSFFTKGTNNDIGIGENRLVEIKANDVISVSTRYANVSILDKPSSADSLKLTVGDNSHYDLNNLDIKNLDIYSTDMGQYNIYSNNNIRNLNYSLLANSVLHVEGHPIQQYNAGKVDGNASIEIKDKALTVQKNLH